MSLRHINGLAIPLSIILLLSFFGLEFQVRARDSASFVRQVEKVFDSMPKKLQSDSAVWLQRRVVPVPSSQVDILALNAAISREYVRLGTFPTAAATIFVAYCDDARSMEGHHPPVCYPASGWSLLGDSSEGFSVQHPRAEELKCTSYRFRKGDLELSVVNGFFCAPNFFAATMEEAREVVKPSLLGGQGLFQFQILFQGPLSGPDLKQYASEIIRSIPRMVFDLVSEGRSGADR